MILYYIEASQPSHYSLPKQTTKPKLHYFEILKRQDNDYEDDTDHLTFGVSQYDGAPQEENPVRDLLAGYDNLFPTEFEDLLGLSRKFQGNTIQFDDDDHTY